MACVIDSIDAFLFYSVSDSKPEILQMWSGEGEIQQWYYRSDERIVSSSCYVGTEEIKPYSGPKDGLNPRVQSHSENYRPARAEMRLAKRIKALGLDSCCTRNAAVYESYFLYSLSEKPSAIDVS